MNARPRIPVWQVDAFATEAFTGNPAAVCLLNEYPADRWLQNVASEMNLSETAFVVPTDQPGHFHLRWFTPAAEVDLCGHATLATAHVLYQAGYASKDQVIHFRTRSGELPCRQTGDLISLDFPVTPVADTVNEQLANEVRSSLAVESADVKQSKFDLVAIVEKEQIVRGAQPDFHRMRKIQTRGIIVTAKSDTAGIDFVSRFFAPQHQIDEDPVTGSAHCCLTPLWAEQLGKTKLVAYQASQRGGKLFCEMIGNRVHLSGTACTVWQGQLLTEPPTSP
ncbi:MAG: PhzF family phenazine biosynthesis protein [Planctomycetota bacterium]|nr:PhzF family phenazine biosynthesis protein [Planctomycetota bacterium]